MPPPSGRPIHQPFYVNGLLRDPKSLLVLQPGLLDNINEINGLAERTTPGCFCYRIDFTEQFRLGSRSPGCSTSTTAGTFRKHQSNQGLDRNGWKRKFLLSD